jgi:eukaryotic translation initiation factor 2C
MPPRMAPGPSRSRGRGGGPPSSRSTGGPTPPGVQPLPSAHITTLGVKRKEPGSGGRPIDIFVNFFVTSLPEGKIHHYDGA